MGIKQQSRSTRQKKRVQTHKRSMIAICAVIVFLIAVMSVSSITLRAKEKTYQTQEKDLQSRIEEEEQRADEIDELETYVGSDEYIEGIAKEKLGLVYDNEIIFQAK